MGNLCYGSRSNEDEKRRSRKLSINVLYNKQKVLKIKKLAIRNVSLWYIVFSVITVICRKNGPMKTYQKYWIKLNKN